MRGWGKARGEETIYILKTVYFLLLIDFLLFTLNLIPCVLSSVCLSCPHVATAGLYTWGSNGNLLTSGNKNNNNNV